MISRATLRTKHRMVPGKETVTYTAPESESVTVAGARFRPIKDLEQFASNNITIDVTQALCILPAENMSGAAPVIDALIVSESEDWAGTWRIESATSGLMKSEYKCLVRQVRQSE